MLAWNIFYGRGYGTIHGEKKRSLQLTRRNSFDFTQIIDNEHPEHARYVPVFIRFLAVASNSHRSFPSTTGGDEWKFYTLYPFSFFPRALCLRKCEGVIFQDAEAYLSPRARGTALLGFCGRLAASLPQTPGPDPQPATASMENDTQFTTARLFHEPDLLIYNKIIFDKTLTMKKLIKLIFSS